MSVESGWPLVAPPHRAPGPEDPATVGPYRIEGVLGDGETGRVYLGRTPAGAAVAVKVIRREFTADGGFRPRLELEVAAARRVQGLYQVPVVDADPRAERPWLASAYVAGPSLRQAVTEYGPGSADAVLRLVAGVAEALQSLHAAGVVHRNLKPGNVLLTADGPRLTDYGISWPGAPGAEVTADVFALGALAYFAVTGRNLAQEPDLTGCPEPLRDIVMACVNPDPGQRPTPAEIVQRCQVTTPVSPVPLPAQPTDALVTQPVIPAPPSTRGLSRRSLLLSAAGLAGLGVAVPLLWPDDDDDDTAGGGKPTAVGPFRLVTTLTGHTMSINSVAFSPDGSLLATMSGAEVFVWDVASRKKRAVLADDTLHAFGLAFSPDGRLLATAGDDPTVSLWDVASREQLATLTGHTGGITDVAFSPDGRLLATASEDETVRLWNVDSGRETAVLGGHNDKVGGVDFHPGGRLLVSCASWAAFLWDLPSGRQRSVLDGHENLWNVAFSPDGATLAASDAAAGDAGGSILFWDTEVIGKQKAVLGGHERPVREMAFSPDGRLLATAGEETAKVWDVASGRQRAAFDTGDPFNEVAFSSTGMLAISSDAQVRLWQM